MTLPVTESLLHRLGWDDGWEAAFTEHRAAGLIPARVAIQHRGAYDLMHEHGEQRASAANRLVREEGLPAVGDWVGLDQTSNLIEALLDLYEATFDARYFREAVALQDVFDAEYSDSRGGYALTTEAHDGLILRLPDADDPPSADLVMLAPEDVEQIVQTEVGGSGLFAPCGVIAGLLARSDAVGVQAEGSAAALRGSTRPQFVLDAAQRQELVQHGVNGFEELRPSVRTLRGARTLLPESAARGEFCDLHTRRLTLWLQACILEGTGWVRLASGGAQQWQRVRGQTEAFLAAAAASGLFGADQDQPRYFVICDERLNSAESVAQGRCCLLFGFAARGAQGYHSCLVTHERSGSSVRMVTSNRLAIEGARVAAEIETAILRQLVSAD